MCVCMCVCILNVVHYVLQGAEGAVGAEGGATTSLSWLMKIMKRCANI